MRLKLQNLFLLSAIKRKLKARKKEMWKKYKEKIGILHSCGIAQDFNPLFYWQLGKI